MKFSSTYNIIFLALILSLPFKFISSLLENVFIRKGKWEVKIKSEKTSVMEWNELIHLLWNSERFASIPRSYYFPFSKQMLANYRFGQLSQSGSWEISGQELSLQFYSKSE